MYVVIIFDFVDFMNVRMQKTKRQETNKVKIMHIKYNQTQA